MSTTTQNDVAAPAKARRLRQSRKTDTTGDNRAAALAALSAAIWTDVAVRDAAIAAYRAAAIMSPNDKGEMMEDVETKNLITFTYFARRLHPSVADMTPEMLAEGQRVATLPGHGSKNVDSAKRTEAQERIATGARGYLFGLRRAAGVSTSDNRGGAHNPNGRPRNPVADIPDAPKATKATKAKPDADAEKYETTPQLRAHFHHVAATLMQMVQKYESICDAKTRSVITRFYKDTAGWEVKPDA